MNAGALRGGLVCLVASLLGGCADSGQPPGLGPELTKGKQVVDGTCKVCHAQGINGAPMLGNAKMWSKRLQQGEDVLVSHAISGFNMQMMPPRGGNPDLTDEEIRLAVRYMMHLATAQ